MKYKKFDTIEEYTAKNTEINLLRGYPSNGTERYAPDEPEVDIDGKFIMPVMPDLEHLFTGLVDSVTWPPDLD